MARRRRVELPEIASLDAEIARARQRCEDQVQQAYARLLQRRAVEGSSHDLYLEGLRPFYETSLAEEGHVNASVWSSTALQAFLGRCFPVYREADAFARFCTALEAAGARWEAGENGQSVVIESFELLKDALRRDTATRMVERDALPFESPVEGRRASSSGIEEDELALPHLVLQGKRPRPVSPTPPASTSVPAPRNPVPATLSPSRPSIGSVNAVHESQSEVSSLCFDDDDDYSVPTNSVVVPTEFTTEVAKKSQNWFGRWRTRHVVLRWNELEMRKKGGVPAGRHSVAQSFPSQPTMPMSAAPSGKRNSQTSSAAVKSKRYALQNLISVQFIQLNESDPSRKQAIDLHFKQVSTGGHGHTTKSLILATDKGVDMLKKIVSLISTLALFRGIVAGEKVPQLKRFVDSGADVNAFCCPPSRKLSVLMSPLQLALVQCSNRSDKTHELSLIKMLQEAGADPRALLHWHFARRTILSANGRDEASVMGLLLPVDELPSPTLQVPLTAFGSDEHGWTLLMYLSLMGDVDRVNVLLHRIRVDVHEREQTLRYIEHINGDGDTALHIAIKASGYERHVIGGRHETVALAIVASSLDGVARPSLPGIFSSSDTTSHTIMHLAIKAKMWRLVKMLLEHKLFESSARDQFGNNALHLLVKIEGSSVDIFESMAQHFKSHTPDDDLDSPDQTAHASPLRLAVHGRREDYVKILLSAGAKPEWCPPHSSSVVGDVGADEPLLHAAIRRGLANAAHSMLCCDEAQRSSVWPSTLSLAVRYGLYRLAYDILRQQIPARFLVSKKDEWWGDAESGFPVTMLAAMAGQLELVAIMVDTGGEGLLKMQHVASGETLLHTLVIVAASNGRDTWKPSQTESMHFGDLLSVDREKVDQEYSRRRSDSPDSDFAAQAVEELIFQGLMVPDTMLTLTANCRHAVATILRKGRANMVPRDETYTLLCAVAGSSHTASFRLLVLLLAAVRIHVEDLSKFMDMITARDGHGETSVFAAMRQGHFGKALLLVHHLLPKILNGDEDQGDRHQHWMEPHGTTLLHLACKQPTNDAAVMIIDLLLGMDACSVLWDARGWCPLHDAIRHGCDARVIQLFKKHDQDLNVWSDATHALRMKDITVAVPLTPLMTAMVYENVFALRELVRCRAEWRTVIPTYRVGILQLAVRSAISNREMMEEVLQLPTIQNNASQDADGMSGIEAAERLCTYLQQRDSPTLKGLSGRDPPRSTPSACPPIAAALLDERASDSGRGNDVLRITLLGLQTPELTSMKELPVVSPTSLSAASFHTSPQRSPSRSVTQEGSVRSRRRHSRSERPSRESSRERIQTPPLPRHPLLEESTLEFLRGEERATLTLIAQQARTEAQEWLKKRSGQKKLLSEARAQLQAIQSHRRTGSGTVFVTAQAAPPVTDAQLLATYKALAEKQFIDKHVASAVADARFVIEREKRALHQETGIFPGELALPSKGNNKDLSFRSNSFASTKGTSGMHRSASINGSMMLLSSRSTELSDPGHDADRNGVPWWSDHGDSSFDDEGSFLGELNVPNGTWLSSIGAGPVDLDEDGKEMVVNPLDCEDFVHRIETRRSMY